MLRSCSTQRREPSRLDSFHFLQEARGHLLPLRTVRGGTIPVPRRPGAPHQHSFGDKSLALSPCTQLLQGDREYTLHRGGGDSSSEVMR